MNHVKVTTQGFVDFVNNQPADKVIDHGSWTKCASGEYIGSEGGISEENVELKALGQSFYIPKNYRSIEYVSRIITGDIVVDDPEADSLASNKVTLRYVLGQTTRAVKLVPTYGHLQKILKGVKINDFTYNVDLRHHDDIEEAS